MATLVKGEKVFGPITYGKSSWKPIRLILSSSNPDSENNDKTHNTLTGYIFGYIAQLKLPNLIKPITVKTKIKYLSEEQIKELGVDWYYTYFSREYGFSLNDGFFQLFYGKQSDDSENKPKCRAWFLPWTQWRFYKHTMYDDKGGIFFEYLESPEIRHSDLIYEKKEECPSVSFLVLDNSDNSEVKVTTKLEKREWRFGDGYFKWLSFFRKHKERIELDIHFEKEVGPGKGSWKGGLIGCSEELQPDEFYVEISPHLTAFQRYCSKTHKSRNGEYTLTFLRQINPVVTT